MFHPWTSLTNTSRNRKEWPPSPSSAMEAMIMPLAPWGLNTTGVDNHQAQPLGQGIDSGEGEHLPKHRFHSIEPPRKRSATAWSVIDRPKMPATSRKGLSKPQYKKTTRKSCVGVLTFLAPAA